jgi:formylmethanofuran dehydrogenase subunit E
MSQRQRLQERAAPVASATRAWIRHERAQGRTVRAEDIDTVERMGDALSLRLLTTPPEELLEIKKLADYLFEVADMFGDRGDVINKDMPRTTRSQ